MILSFQDFGLQSEIRSWLLCKNYHVLSNSGLAHNLACQLYDALELDIARKYVLRLYHYRYIKVADTILYHDTFTLLVSSVFLMKHEYYIY